MLMKFREHSVRSAVDLHVDQARCICFSSFFFSSAFSLLSLFLFCSIFFFFCSFFFFNSQKCFRKTENRSRRGKENKKCGRNYSFILISLPCCLFRCFCCCYYYYYYCCCCCCNCSYSYLAHIIFKFMFRIWIRLFIIIFFLYLLNQINLQNTSCFVFFFLMLFSCFFFGLVVIWGYSS